MLLLTALPTPRGRGSDVLRINGSTTVNLPVAEAAEILRRERGLRIVIDTQGGSAGGIAMLGDGHAHVGMSSKPVTDTDRARFPQVRFHETVIGVDAVALVVSRDVWDGGVRSLTRDQARGIYEGTFRNWHPLGGPDRRIAFFNKEPGRGTWEVFVHWLYDDARHAPPVSFPEVGGNEEARAKVASTRGAIAPLSASWTDHATTFPLGLRLDADTVVHPSPADLSAGRYPLSRSLYLLTDGEPSGAASELIQLLLSDRGQVIVRRHGYQPALPPAH